MGIADIVAGTLILVGFGSIQMAMFFGIGMIIKGIFSLGIFSF
jgi:hypothetical protein